MTVLVYFYLAFVQNIMLARIKWGVVSDEEGKPFLSTIVTLLTEENKMVARTVTDEEGRFLLIADKGNYVLEVAAVGQQPRQLFSVELKQLGSVNEDIMV